MGKSIKDFKLKKYNRKITKPKNKISIIKYLKIYHIKNKKMRR